MIRWILLAVLLTSCGVDSEELDGDGSALDADGGAVDDSGTSNLPVRLKIEFDYRYDTFGFFDDPIRRSVLEEAAKSWGRVLGDDFPSIPAGTSVRTRNPENPTVSGMSFPIDREIDDVLIFMGCSDIDGPGGINAMSNHAAALNSVTDSTLRNALTERYHGSDFEPWTGWISFDCLQQYYFDETLNTTNDIPGSLTDFWSVAMHEIAHVLGFGTADAFAALSASQPIRFTGSSATALYGGDIPLSSSGTHFQSGVLSSGIPTLMDPSRPGGTRTEPTALDIAALLDLGYESTSSNQ